MKATAEAWTSEFLLHPSKAVLDELATAEMPEAFWACVNTQGLQTHRHARDHGWLTGTQVPGVFSTDDKLGSPCVCLKNSSQMCTKGCGDL